MQRSDDPQAVRVVIVDDERLMRAGLRLMIDGSDGIEVVGEAADGVEALEVVAAQAPDLALMDIRMPRMDGIATTRRLRESADGPAIVVLTAFDTDGFLLDALRAGAVSFLLKDSPPDQVVQAIHEAARGDARFSPAVLQRLVSLASGGVEASGPEAVPGTPHDPDGSRSPREERPSLLTDREWEVGRLLAQGLTNSEIAETLFLSLPTIKTHVGHLFEKLLVTNRVQLAIRVLELEGKG